MDKGRVCGCFALVVIGQPSSTPPPVNQSTNLKPLPKNIPKKQATDLFGSGDVGPDPLGSRGRNAASATAQEAHEAIRPSITDAGGWVWERVLCVCVCWVHRSCLASLSNPTEFT